MNEKQKEIEQLYDSMNWYANEIADMRQDCEVKWWVYDRFVKKFEKLSDKYYKLCDELGVKL